MNSLLVLDTHYLCHRAFHSQTDLSWNGIATGVIFGFLKTISQLKNEFQTDRIAFCFEGSTLYRKIDFPEYKAKRARNDNADPVKKKARWDLTMQINDLRVKHLPRIGFKNIFYYPGYESDDIMARLAQREEDVILVTSDADMYQCLRNNVTMYSPQKQKLFTEKWFRNEYGIEPKIWSLVKAISGCDTDGVPGIPGVGELTALRFVRGEAISKPSGARELIQNGASKEIVCRNRRLVQLPYEGTPNPEIAEDSISPKGWDDVCSKLGIRSLAGRPPVFSRRLLRKEK